VSIRPTHHAVLDKALRNLRNALVKLDGTADRYQARRNGRNRALTALRRMRTALDESYPSITITREKKRLKTTKGRLDRARREGWADVYGDHDIAAYAAAGVRVKKITVKDLIGGGEFITRTYWFVPAWAKAIGWQKPSELRAAKRSVTLKRAALATQALAADGKAS
jgi:hypothetical protein